MSATSSQASDAASDGLFARRLAAIAFIDVETFPLCSTPARACALEAAAKATWADE